MDIFTEIETAHRDNHTVGLTNYYCLLTRVDLANPSPEDREELATALRQLGKSSSQARDDYATVQKAMADTVASTPEALAAAQEAAERTAAKHLEVCAERQEAWQRLNDSVVVAAGEKESARDELGRRREAGLRVARLQRDNPAMWTALSAPAPAPKKPPKRAR